MLSHESHNGRVKWFGLVRFFWSSESLLHLSFFYWGKIGISHCWRKKKKKKTLLVCIPVALPLVFRCDSLVNEKSWAVLTFSDSDLIFANRPVNDGIIDTRTKPNIDGSWIPCDRKGLFGELLYLRGIPNFLLLDLLERKCGVGWWLYRMRLLPGARPGTLDPQPDRKCLPCEETFCVLTSISAPGSNKPAKRPRSFILTTTRYFPPSIALHHCSIPTVLKYSPAKW